MTTTNPPSEPITITFLSTGTVQIRQSMLSQPAANKSVLMRRLRCLVDSAWTPSLPIGAFLIRHPDGPVLFDAGESPRCNDPGFLPFYSPTPLFSRTAIEPRHGIVELLRAQGVEPRHLQALVLSHLHGDHAGGLADLLREAPDLPVYVSARHWAAFGNSPLAATLAGCNPQRWPAGFAPKLLLPLDSDPDSAEASVGPWARASRITADGRVLAVETPGHVPGHVSLVVRGWHRDEGEGEGEGEKKGRATTYFLPGDATYGIEVLDREEADGINDDPAAARGTLRRIKEFARAEDVVVLPSHDPGTPGFLRDRTVYRPRDVGE